MNKTYILIAIILVLGVFGLMATNWVMDEASKSIRLEVIEECEATSWELYTLDWDNACGAEGLGRDCELTYDIKDRLDASLDKAYDRCYRL